MREKHGKGVHITTTALALAAAAGAAGCSVGQGSPDGWRYLRSGPVAVALPKTWRTTADGAMLPGIRGRTDAALTIDGVATAVPGPVGEALPARDALPEDIVPSDARNQTLILDGRTARITSFARPAPDGRPAGHVEVRVKDAAGRPLVLRAWAVDGTAGDPALLQEIVNSIEFPR